MQLRTEDLWPGGPQLAQGEGGFKLSTDSVLLADFVRTPGARRAADLGCGTGVLPVLLAARAPQLHIVGIELQNRAAEICRYNMQLNHLEERVEILEQDLRLCTVRQPAGEFDLVVTNPPYFQPGSGGAPAQPARRTARQEDYCTISDVCAAASHLLRYGGRFFMVHRPDRLPDIMTEMRRVRIEPKRLRLVCHMTHKPPSLLLIEGRKNGGTGLRIEPNLVLCNQDGTATEEMKRIYHISGG